MTTVVLIALSELVDPTSSYRGTARTQEGDAGGTSVDGSHQPMLPCAEKAGSSSRPLSRRVVCTTTARKLDFASSRSAHHLPDVPPW